MSSNLIAQYDTAEGTVEIHGLKGGFTLFLGERILQKDLGARDLACYFAHAMHAMHYKLAKDLRPEGSNTLTPAMIVAGANVEPPCPAGEFIERWRAAVAARVPQTRDPA